MVKKVINCIYLAFLGFATLNSASLEESIAAIKNAVQSSQYPTMDPTTKVNSTYIQTRSLIQALENIADNVRNEAFGSRVQNIVDRINKILNAFWFNEKPFYYSWSGTLNRTAILDTFDIKDKKTVAGLNAYVEPLVEVFKQVFRDNNLESIAGPDKIPLDAYNSQDTNHPLSLYKNSDKLSLFNTSNFELTKNYYTIAQKLIIDREKSDELKKLLTEFKEKFVDLSTNKQKELFFGWIGINSYKDPQYLSSLIQFAINNPHQAPPLTPPAHSKEPDKPLEPAKPALTNESTFGDIEEYIIYNLKAENGVVHVKKIQELQDQLRQDLAESKFAYLSAQDATNLTSIFNNITRALEIFPAIDGTITLNDALTTITDTYNPSEYKPAKRLINYIRSDAKQAVALLEGDLEAKLNIPSLIEPKYKHYTDAYLALVQKFQNLTPADITKSSLESLKAELDAIFKDDSITKEYYKDLTTSTDSDQKYLGTLIQEKIDAVEKKAPGISIAEFQERINKALANAKMGTSRININNLRTELTKINDDVKAENLNPNAAEKLHEQLQQIYHSLVVLGPKPLSTSKLNKIYVINLATVENEQKKYNQILADSTNSAKSLAKIANDVLQTALDIIQGKKSEALLLQTPLDKALKNIIPEYSPIAEFGLVTTAYLNIAADIAKLKQQTQISKIRQRITGELAPLFKGLSLVARDIFAQWLGKEHTPAMQVLVDELNAKEETLAPTKEKFKNSIETALQKLSFKDQTRVDALELVTRLIAVKDSLADFKRQNPAISTQDLEDRIDTILHALEILNIQPNGDLKGYLDLSGAEKALASLKDNYKTATSAKNLIKQTYETLEQAITIIKDQTTKPLAAITPWDSPASNTLTQRQSFNIKPMRRDYIQLANAIDQAPSLDVLLSLRPFIDKFKNTYIAILNNKNVIAAFTSWIHDAKSTTSPIEFLEKRSAEREKELQPVAPLDPTILQPSLTKLSSALAGLKTRI